MSHDPYHIYLWVLLFICITLMINSFCRIYAMRQLPIFRNIKFIICDQLTLSFVHDCNKNNRLDIDYLYISPIGGDHNSVSIAQ